MEILKGKGAIRDLFMAVIPTKRAVEAEEIAAAAIFLASEHGRSINGEKSNDGVC